MVIGGSVAGILAAAVAAPHFREASSPSLSGPRAQSQPTASHHA